MYKIKHNIMFRAFVIAVLLILCAAETLTAFASAVNDVHFTDEELAFIDKTQNGEPVRMGILPSVFPLSSCPPETEDFSGLNVELLRIITENSGLTFDYCRIPLEEMTPYAFLQSEGCTLVAGTIKLARYVNDPELILSDRLSDGTAICIANKNTDIRTIQSGIVSILHGYQAGLDFATRDFSDFTIKLYDDNAKALDAVRTGEADAAIISRYVGEYLLQKPLNNDLMVIPDYEFLLDSCIMGIRTPETELIVSIINKSIQMLSLNEYNHVQMNFIVENPYNFTFLDFAYKYRYIIMVCSLALVALVYLCSRQIRSKRTQILLSIDGLTGAYTEPGFNLHMQKALLNAHFPIYIVNFDIENFHSYNELYGRQAGDALLKEIVATIRPYMSKQDLICRVYADNFMVLYTQGGMDILMSNIQITDLQFTQIAEKKIKIRYGIYEIKDGTLPVSKIFDYATQAKKSAGVNSHSNIGVFNETIYQKDIEESKLISQFPCAIKNNEFVPYYQPKFDAQTKKISGAEALVRWRELDGSLRFPGDFVDLFEKSGQLQQLDFYMLEQVCDLQRRLLDEGITPVTISVNFSPLHLNNRHLIQSINAVVERYGVPKNLIEIEWTETAMAIRGADNVQLFSRLRHQGYLVTMDDFGKAYSSLNMLSEMPLDIIKLDRGFMESILCGGEKQEKTRGIVRQIISLARTLSLKVVAEGIETQEQYDFLRDAGCNYIQGYYFSRPVEESKFLGMLSGDTWED